MDEKKHGRRFYVSGRVQGVGYRFFACSAAQEQEISGYVRNLRDGRVEVYAIGTERQLAVLRDALKRGPQLARVKEISEDPAELLLRYTASFSIERD